MWQPYNVYEQIRITEFYSMFEKTFDSDFSFDGEMHNFWECVIVLSGKVCASGDSRIYHLEKGDAIFHKPMELHKILVEDKSARLFIFSFSAYGSLLEALENKTVHLSKIQSDALSDLLKYVRSYPAEDEGSVHMYLEYFKQSKLYSNLAALYAELFLIAVCNDFTVVRATKEASEQLFEKAIRFMHENISLDISVDDIAKHCCVSPSSLKKVFRKYSNFGIHKYFLKMKIAAASQLLADGEDGSAIATKLGFCSQAYFSAAFKRETGLTPSEFAAIRL